MELIPILSLIILVATISTFVLSIGAYVLYKLREKKGKAAEQPKPETIPAELVTPQVAPETMRVTSPGLRSTYAQSLYSTRGETSPMFATNGGQTRPEMRPTVLGLSMDEEAAVGATPPPSGRTTVNAERFETRGRFSRYTSTGYSNMEEPIRKNKEDEEPLRWR